MARPPSGSWACPSRRCPRWRRSWTSSWAASGNRPLDRGPYAFCWIDALAQKVREGGRTVNVHCLIATGVNAERYREILGIDVTSSQDGAGWLAFLRGLTARGLSGVQPATSDDHAGPVNAIAAVLPGAAWQRCRTHKFPAAAAHLDDAREDILAFTAFPVRSGGRSAATTRYQDSRPTPTRSPPGGKIAAEPSNGQEKSQVTALYKPPRLKSVVLGGVRQDTQLRQTPSPSWADAADRC